MNEVTQVHLGRQSFTISVDAHHDLKNYLASIQKKVGDEEVVREVELRMSELLIERGVTEDKVVLPEDVDYLKEQLGKPEDFGDDESDDSTTPDRGSRRLFRDTDNALIAGVAAGVGNYFGLNAVVVRIAFIVLTIISWGTGIIVYILLWLILPPARTASEKLQMQGKQVTLEALKDSVAKAEIPEKTKRVNDSILSAINAMLRFLVKLAGVGFILSGLGVLFGVGVTKAYMMLHHGKLIQENYFPVGGREQWLLGLVMGLAVIAALFLLLTGIATFKRKWPIGGWVTGVLVGLFLIGSAASMALAADAVPRIRDRYETSVHTTAVKNIQPFTKVQTTGNVDISYVSSAAYAVNFHYAGKPDVSQIKVDVKDGTLYIDSTQFDKNEHCNMLCIFPRYDLTVQIYAPNVENFKTPRSTDIFYPDVPPLPVNVQ
jgi:phage shock protein PspC (stress-responsive transcriptional regulator)